MAFFSLSRTIDEEHLVIVFTNTNVESFTIMAGRLNDAGGINTYSGLNMSIKKIGTGAGPSTVYKILPYNVEIAIYRGAGHNILRIIETTPTPSGRDDLFTFDIDIPVNFSDDIKRKLDDLMRELPERSIRSTGRNVASLAVLGRARGLPEDLEGEIAGYLTGERGRLGHQMNRQRVRAGLIPESEVRPRSAPYKGGKRTRRRRRQ